MPRCDGRRRWDRPVVGYDALCHKVGLDCKSARGGRAFVGQRPVRTLRAAAVVPKRLSPHNRTVHAAWRPLCEQKRQAEPLLAFFDRVVHRRENRCRESRFSTAFSGGHRSKHMRTHYLQHVPFESLGSIEPWLKAQGHEITSTRFFESSQLPDPEEVDFLIVLGGPMSANDEDRLPWLVAEKAFIRECIRRRKRVLGICLGAQLIASAMGAGVYANRVKEIGWFPVQGVPTQQESAFRFPAVFSAFHWHGETFDLPPGAVQIARTDGCENQAFQIGKFVIGLQFHLEMTPDSVKEIVTHCRTEIVPSVYVQSEAAILGVSPTKYHEINELMAKILSFLTRNIE